MTVEKELAYLIEVGDPSGYMKAHAVEMHEQWEFRLPSEEGVRRGRVRVRKTTRQNENRFEETLKVPLETMGDKEVTTEITEKYFETWKQCFGVRGQSKIRYSYIVPDVKINLQGTVITLPKIVMEVDVFMTAKGERGRFAKVDIEIQEIVKYVKENYPDIEELEFNIDFTCLPLDVRKVVDFMSKDAGDREGIKAFFDFFSIQQENIVMPQPLGD